MLLPKWAFVIASAMGERMTLWLQMKRTELGRDGDDLEGSSVISLATPMQNANQSEKAARRVKVDFDLAIQPVL